MHPDKVTSNTRIALCPVTRRRLSPPPHVAADMSESIRVVGCSVVRQNGYATGNCGWMLSFDSRIIDLVGDGVDLALRLAYAHRTARLSSRGDSRATSTSFEQRRRCSRSSA